MPSLRGRRAGDLRVVVNVVIPRHLKREQRELLDQARRVADRREPPHSEDGVLHKLKRALGGETLRASTLRSGTPMIRLAVRVSRDQPSSSLPSCSSSPPAASRRSTSTATSSSTPSTVAPGELPALPDLRAAAGRGARRGHHDRGRRRLGGALARVPPAARARRPPDGPSAVGAGRRRPRSTS